MMIKQLMKVDSSNSMYHYNSLVTIYYSDIYIYRPKNRQTCLFASKIINVQSKYKIQTGLYVCTINTFKTLTAAADDIGHEEDRRSMISNLRFGFS